MSRNHPELAFNEHFVGNTDETANGLPAHVAHLKTARLGKVAYSIDGHVIKDPAYRPLIIGDADYEAYDQIMMARFRAINRGF